MLPAALAALLLGCAQVPSGDLQPGERPGLETTEAGLWMLMDKMEERLKTSGRVVEDDALDAYMRDIVCRLEPAHCPHIRIYVVDVPYFNANMAPNGMMQVWTGLLVRTENEAQLAFVLGHELAHYVRRHSLQRDGVALAVGFDDQPTNPVRVDSAPHTPHLDVLVEELHGRGLLALPGVEHQDLFHLPALGVESCPSSIRRAQ